MELKIFLNLDKREKVLTLLDNLFLYIYFETIN